MLIMYIFDKNYTKMNSIPSQFKIDSPLQQQT